MRTSRTLTRRPDALLRRGMTLIEILFVMSIVAILFGIGLGAFSSLNLDEKAAKGTVETTLRAANNWAMARNAPATVQIDPKARTIQAVGMQVIGTWRFEALPVRGAFELDGSQRGRVELDPRGYRGKSLSFLGAPSGSLVSVPVQADPAYDLSNGFEVRCVVKRLAASGGQVLKLGEVIELDVTETGSVRASFSAVRTDEFGDERSAGRTVLETEPGRVPLGEWTRLTLQYDRKDFKISVNGLVSASVEQDGRVAPVEEALHFGGSGSPFPGSIDDVVLAGVGEEEVFVLPDGIEFAKGTPTVVRFAGGGGLDRRAHREPVRVGLVYADGFEEWILVSLYGAVE